MLAEIYKKHSWNEYEKMFLSLLTKIELVVDFLEHNFMLKSLRRHSTFFSEVVKNKSLMPVSCFNIAHTCILMTALCIVSARSEAFATCCSKHSHYQCTFMV